MLSALLQDIDVVFHEAAYGGYMPEMAKYVLVNSFGTAQMLEMIRDHNLPIKQGCGCQFAGRVQRRRGVVPRARACGSSCCGPADQHARR